MSHSIEREVPPLTVSSPSSLTQSTTALAARAGELSTELYAIQETCQRAGGEVERTATELEMLATTLNRLAHEIIQHPNRYTDVFSADLGEVLTELDLVMDEISQCSLALQQPDPTVEGAVSSLLKQPEVYHLQKHLEALKTTLVVMRTALHYGKDFVAPPVSTATEESMTVRVSQARAVFDAAMIQNRDTIESLRTLDAARARSPATDGPSDGRDRVDAAGTAEPGFGRSSDERSFSHRRLGKRLGVHTFLVNISGHPCPSILHHEWLHLSPEPSPDVQYYADFDASTGAYFNTHTNVHLARLSARSAESAPAAAPSQPPNGTQHHRHTNKHDHNSSLTSADFPSSHFSSSSSSPDPPPAPEEHQPADRALVRMSRRLSRSLRGRHG